MSPQNFRQNLDAALENLKVRKNLGWESWGVFVLKRCILLGFFVGRFIHLSFRKTLYIVVLYARTTHQSPRQLSENPYRKWLFLPLIKLGWSTWWCRFWIWIRQKWAPFLIPPQENEHFRLSESVPQGQKVLYWSFFHKAMIVSLPKKNDIFEAKGTGSSFSKFQLSWYPLWGPN